MSSPRARLSARTMDHRLQLGGARPGLPEPPHQASAASSSKLPCTSSVGDSHSASKPWRIRGEDLRAISARPWPVGVCDMVG